jgi:hypothetical protein
MQALAPMRAPAPRAPRAASASARRAASAARAPATTRAAAASSSAAGDDARRSERRLRYPNGEERVIRCARTRPAARGSARQRCPNNTHPCAHAPNHLF